MNKVKKLIQKEELLLNIVCIIIFFLFIAYWKFNHPNKIGFTDCGKEYIHSNNPYITPFEPQVTSCFLKAFTNCSKAQVIISDTGIDSGGTTTAVIDRKKGKTCNVSVRDQTWGMVNYSEKKDIQEVCSLVKIIIVDGEKQLAFDHCIKM